MARSTGTKRAILDAALELAASRGITGTTMDEVAERAGVAKGSLYYNFSSKDKLFEALLNDGAHLLAERLNEAKGELRGWDAMRAIIAALLDSIQGNVPLAKLIAGEVFRTDRPWAESVNGFRQQAVGVFAAAIAEEQPKGADSGLQSLMASSVFGSVLSAGLEWLLFQPERSRDEVVEAVIASHSGALAG
ncbi:TetR/AcrR family transcriptional regulator [Lysinibacter cavernae]|uniref:AcrR family transcriptional regulator n=1 Tax=Lysinibacter cavernae TaxID=1640652 RepID=A0A7X5R1R4_9MICO|nr:TetR/AcrR family transcriptional regulator [Lysinibacter cavernae]NIH54001.1 AcrR family transcriptional regulator [Lysinibacter cavernae]